MSKKLLFILALVAAMACLAAVALRFGATLCPLPDLGRALFRDGTNQNLEYFVWNLRMPKIVAALAVGSALAVNGAVLQTVLKNPLASSFTLGQSHGAAFGACYAMIALASTSFNTSISMVALGAFAGSLCSSACILVLASVRGMTSYGLILAGVAISTFFAAATMSLQYFATDSQVAATLFWTFGDLSKGAWTEAWITAATSAAGIAASLRLSWDYDALQWGDDHAASLGVAVRRVRVLSVLIASLLVAVATAFYGVIGFVGLIAPHMVRLLFRHCGHAFLITASALFGAAFLLGADLLAQSLLYPVLLPIGILCSFTGVPIFLFLLLRRSMQHA
ncbi:MAG: FecCD family ABC transporter permease [Desulfovibrio sp.]